MIELKRFKVDTFYEQKSRLMLFCKETKKSLKVEMNIKYWTN